MAENKTRKNELYLLNKTEERDIHTTTVYHTWLDAFIAMATDVSKELKVTIDEVVNSMVTPEYEIGLTKCTAWGENEDCNLDWAICRMYTENGKWKTESLSSEFDCEQTPVDYGTYALIEITQDKQCRLLATLNPDANEPICGESYGSAWSIPIADAVKRFRKEGFWNVWSEINGSVAGGIDLTDGLKDEDIADFMQGNVLQEVLCGDSAFVAWYINKLDVGVYLIAVEP